MNRFFLCLFLLPVLMYGQNNAFKTGEQLKFTAAYNMSGIMTDLAEVTMETSEIKTSKSTLMRLKCTAATYSKWDSFFKIRDLYESYVNPNTLTPYLYKRDINEGGYIKFVQYKYNQRTKNVSSLIRKSNRQGGTYDINNNFSIGSNTKDLVATIYKLRTLDIHKANPGDSDTFVILFDNTETTIKFTYIKTETIPTAIGNKSCYKLAISIQGSNVLKGKNSNLIWLTADDNKVPVFAKFNIAVGSGELKIKSVKGLKNNS